MQDPSQPAMKMSLPLLAKGSLPYIYSKAKRSASPPLGGEALPIWEERQRNTVICLLTTSFSTTEGGPVGAPKFWRRESHNGVSQHKAWHKTRLQQCWSCLAVFGTVLSHSTTLLLRVCHWPEMRSFTYLSMQPSVQSQESTNRLEKLLR